MAACPRCQAALPDGTAFCTRCGLRLEGARPATQPPAGRAVPPPRVEARFVACPDCGATNAASRRRCARCDRDLHTDPAPPPRVSADPRPAEGASPIDPGDGEVLGGTAGSPLAFAAVVTVAGLALVGVLVTILSAGGVGPFGADPQDAPEEEVAVAIAAVRASSTLQPQDGAGHGPENLIDEDAATVWRADTDGDGGGEWVELTLEGETEVSRLLLWNGDQRGDAFATTTRAATVRIDLDDRTFEADLLDVDGPQAVDLPETVRASTVRVTVVAVLPGSGELTLSDVEVQGPPPSAQDPDDMGDAAPPSS